MKRFAIRLVELRGTYTIPCGSSAYIRLDGRESINSNLVGLRETLVRRGFDNFVIVTVPNLRVKVLQPMYILYRNTEKNLPLVD
jgi:hypothetical protein